MFNSLLLTTATLLLLTTPIHAVCGIHTFGHCEDKIIHWYDPLTGEICDPVDCGGGRAPPKTNVPGCGTIPLGPASYLSCWTPGFTGAPGPATVAHQSTTEEAAPVKTTAAQVQSTIVVTQSLVTPTKETTAVAAPSSAEGGKEGSSAVVSTKASSTPETTAPAVLPSGQTGAQTGASNGTATSSSTSKPKTTDGTGAGAVVRGSVMAVVGAVVGVIVLV
jgi:hypothetical protein